MFLFLIIYLHHNHTDILVIAVICHFRNMPVAREEDEELVGRAVVKTSARLVIVVVNHVGTILAVRLAGKVVDDAETFHALYHILEVYVMVVAFTASLLQGIVLAILNTYRKLGAWYRMLALWYGKKVSLGDEVEECLPLLRILLVLQVEVYEVYAAVSISLGETIAPLTFLIPFLGSLDQLWLVAVVLGVAAITCSIAT